jgi:hypothetical protein
MLYIKIFKNSAYIIYLYLNVKNKHDLITKLIELLFLFNIQYIKPYTFTHIFSLIIKPYSFQKLLMYLCHW